MKMDGIDGPMRIKINSDGSTRINMGVKGVITQKMDGANQEPAAECEQHLDGRVCDDAKLTKLMAAGGTGGKQVLDMTGLKGNYSLALDLSLAELMAMAQSSGLGMPRPGAVTGWLGGRDGFRPGGRGEHLRVSAGARAEDGEPECAGDAAGDRPRGEDADGELIGG